MISDCGLRIAGWKGANCNPQPEIRNPPLPPVGPAEPPTADSPAQPPGLLNVGGSLVTWRLRKLIIPGIVNWAGAYRLYAASDAGEGEPAGRDSGCYGASCRIFAKH